MMVIYFLRTGKIPFIQSSPSKIFLAVTLFFQLIAQALPYIPGLNQAFGFVHPEPVRRFRGHEVIGIRVLT